MLCDKLHCQKGFKLKLFFYKICVWVFKFRESLGSRVSYIATWIHGYMDSWINGYFFFCINLQPLKKLSTNYAPFAHDREPGSLTDIHGYVDT